LAEGVPGYAWWQWGIIYQVYPRSFMDSNGDGVGDLPGITSRLDYLQSLGVTAIWISPIYPSPMVDFGYDVSDYTGIHPLFGTLADFDRLVEESHRRGLRVIMDFVPNHTSDQHPWFLESRSSRDSPKRDWYIWRDAKPDGSLPNNWVAHFGGVAWDWDEVAGQYYLHSFLKEQPDLNWRNPEVVEAMMDVLRFWLDRGVDGFRVDVMWETIKDAELRDNPPNPGYVEGKTHPYFKVLPEYNHDRPEVHEVVREMRAVLDEYGDRVLIGEIYLPVPRLVAYYGENGDGCHMPYNFQLVLMRWDARRIAAAIDAYEGHLPNHGWPNWVIGNHDRPRIVAKAGRKQAGVAAMLLLTLRGTPTMYYGDELGMDNVPIPPEAVQDPQERNIPGLGAGRDPERTPMQWDSGPNARFTTGKPWLPVAADYQRVNVATESEDPQSVLSLYRRLIRLRQSEPALMVGSYEAVPAEGDIVAYIRTDGEKRFLIILNLGPEKVSFDLPEGRGLCQVVACTDVRREGTDVFEALEVRGDEALVIALD
jgi:alpha-glucosidase